MSATQELSRELSDLLVLELLQDRTRYIVDSEAGEVYSVKTGEPLYRLNPAQAGHNSRADRDYVRLKCRQKRRSISISRLVWMYSRNCVVPEGCEIHHINEDSSDNRAVNLVCIHKQDHSQVHRLLSGDTPF